MPRANATRTLTLILAVSMGVLAYSKQTTPSQQTTPGRAWEGYAILGSGHLTAVYSDDPRITQSTHARGVQHLYFGDYTADYIASTSFQLIDPNGAAISAAGADPTVGMKNFFTAQTQTSLPNGASQTVLCFVHPDDAVVLSVSAGASGHDAPYKFEAQLRNPIKTDRTITLLSLDVQQNTALATWSNGTVLAILPASHDAQTKVTESSVVISGLVKGNGGAEQVLLIPGSSKSDALSKVRTFRQNTNIDGEASELWNGWINSGKSPVFKADTGDAAQYLEAYKRNLYCVKSANLNGQIPADITGQFVTNNMPQLYPRDAMMCARALLQTGHTAEAKQVIAFWANRKLPMKTPGEWYARYDAHAKAVDAGSGARFDEPEWDSNGYFIYLVSQYHKQTGVWLANKALIYELADFLVNHLDRNGLLYEGGIVEWTGYLPATNMICSQALKEAADIADEAGDRRRAESYRKSSSTIAHGMEQMFDPTRQTYADVRFAQSKGANNQSIGNKSGQRLYLWDTTANVGIIWGYPNHHEMELTNDFYTKNTVKLDGGMQYFDSSDPGLAEYGHGVFFFTTAAAAEYQLLQGNATAGKGFLDWMLRNANSYGLMPEHISPDGQHCSPASPLSWCSAEFAAAVLLWSQL